MNTQKKTEKEHLPIKCITAGKPIFLMPVTKPHTSSKHCSRTSMYKRTIELDNMRQFIAGPSPEDADVQLENELKTLGKLRQVDKKRNNKVIIEEKDALVIKEELGLSWRMNSRMREMMKPMGVHIRGEAKMRRLSKDIILECVSSILLHFVFTEKTGRKKNQVTEKAPIAYIEDLESLLHHLLDSYSAAGMLTWHDGVIPEDQIWIKVGGDHGKHSLKLTLQIINLARPNSKQNVFVFANTPVPDNFDNLRTVFEFLKLKEKLESFKDLIWRGKKIVVFLTGDYEFLTKIYGLSGSAGTYPCLWCLMQKRHFNSNTSPDQRLRSLDGMQVNYERYLVKFREKKKDAARCFNNIHMPLVIHPLDHVSIPDLHITLGLVKRHHNLLEAAVHELDCMIADLPDRYLKSQGQKIKDFGGNWKIYCDLEIEMNHLQTCVVLCSDENEKRIFENDKKRVCEKMDSVEHERLRTKFDDTKKKREGLGMICLSLDKILDKHKITPQKFHSRSFIGNHCHRYLKQEVFQDITQFIVNQTEQLTYCPFTIDKAHMLKYDFDSLNARLSKVHSQISHCRPITEQQIHEIEHDIQSYMTLYRQLFVNKTTPKHHILEKHCVPFLRRTRVGLGLTAEQGVEISHQLINKIDKRASGIMSDLQRSKFILEAGLLHNTPNLRYLQKPKEVSD